MSRNFEIHNNFSVLIHTILVDTVMFIPFPAYVVSGVQEERKIELLDNLSIAVEKVRINHDRMYLRVAVWVSYIFLQRNHKSNFQNCRKMSFMKKLNLQVLTKGICPINIWERTKSIPFKRENILNSVCGGYD